MHNIIISDGSVIIDGVEPFELVRSCGCGQAFRWKERDGGCFGVVRGRAAFVSYRNGRISIAPCAPEDAAMWLEYFDVERDYDAIERMIAEDERIGACLPFARGIRVFNQEPFETLISFIISANNNVKRISGIIDRLCELAGKQIDVGEERVYAFPEPEAIAALSVEQLAAIGAGYRAPFIKKSAGIVADGYELERLRNMPLDEARRELISFPGIGPKVADCVLLFSLGHTDAFPIDVWMNRAMCMLFFGNEQPTKKEMNAMVERLGRYSGILQQYIFHYARATGLGTGKNNK